MLLHKAPSARKLTNMRARIDGHRSLPPWLVPATWNQHDLRRVLREFEEFCNHHRPHQGIANARPLCPLAPLITDPGQIALRKIRRQQLGGILTEYQHDA